MKQNHYLNVSENDDDKVVYARKITFNGEPEYTCFGEGGMYLESNGEILDLPEHISVTITNNTDNSAIRQCYINYGTNSTMKSNLEITMDYSEKEFENLWSMLLNLEGGTIEIKAGINIEDIRNQDSIDIVNIDIDRNWVVSEFSVRCIKNL